MLHDVTLWSDLPYMTGDRQGRARGHFEGSYGRFQEGYRGGAWCFDRCCEGGGARFR